MVSKARLDLPEPERPVTTISLSRGISSDTFLRLCTRAPCTAMVVRAAALPFLELIRRFSQMNERQFLDGDVALLRELDGRGDFADKALVGQVLARGGDAHDVEVTLEPGLDLAARPRFGGLAEVVEHKPEQRCR